MIMEKFLYYFNFPAPWPPEQQDKWHQENVGLFFVESASEDQALAWGNSIANKCIESIYSGKELLERDWQGSITKDFSSVPFEPALLEQATTIAEGDEHEAQRFVESFVAQENIEWSESDHENAKKYLKQRLSGH